ncbi:MAG TPA: ABC transporter permease [Mycobacteriales bacterium]|jgi:ABC-2 type transport system permease protein|nr:ABC transporter permease [Mycobacteriales bacterium]
MTMDGVRTWLLLLRWQLLRNRRLLVTLVLIQVALGVGMIYGFGFLVPHITPEIAVFFATGAPTLGMLIVGLTVVPQETALARVNGRFSYVAALPVPRLAPMCADVTFWLLVQLPGWVATLLLAVVHFHLHLRFDALVVPAVVLVSLSAAAVGYGVAVLFPPGATQQVSSFMSIALLLFSPINFPLDRLPDWLQNVHRALPVTYMADLIRGGLTGRYDVSPGLAFAVVGGYCAVGLFVAGWAARRRT